VSQLPLLPLGLFTEEAASLPARGLARRKLRLFGMGRKRSHTGAALLLAAPQTILAVDGKVHQKTLAEQKSDFTAEGAPPPVEVKRTSASCSAVVAYVSPLHCIRDA
jgi:hypothetical protein